MGYSPWGPKESDMTERLMCISSCKGPPIVHYSSLYLPTAQCVAGIGGL